LFSLFYHENKFLSKIDHVGADINGDGKLHLPEMIYILRKAAGVRDTWNQQTFVERKEGIRWPDR